MKTRQKISFNKTQYGKVIISLLLIFLLALVVFYNKLKSSGPSGEIAALSTMITLVIIGLLFYRLKVGLNDSEITLTFGVGIIKKRIELSQIQSVEAVKNKFWYGWGIRLTPHGWLWNIAGYDAVELTFKQKKRKFRIGCEDCAELKAAIDLKKAQEVVS